MRAGAEEYGELTFLKRDTIGDVMEEIADVMNWARFTYLKMYMVKKAYEAVLERPEETPDGFITMESLFGKRDL